MSYPEVGTTFTFDKVFVQQDYDQFAALSGDHNPIHVDPEFSANTRFGRTVSHGMLLYSVLRTLLEDKLGNIRQVSQDLMFTAPTFTGDNMVFTWKVTEVNGNKISLDAEIIREKDGTVVTTGNTVVEKLDA